MNILYSIIKHSLLNNIEFYWMTKIGRRNAATTAPNKGPTVCVSSSSGKLQKLLFLFESFVERVFNESFPFTFLLFFYIYLLFFENDLLLLSF